MILLTLLALYVTACVLVRIVDTSLSLRAKMASTSVAISQAKAAKDKENDQGVVLVQDTQAR